MLGDPWGREGTGYRTGLEVAYENAIAAEDPALHSVVRDYLQPGVTFTQALVNAYNDVRLADMQRELLRANMQRMQQGQAPMPSQAQSQYPAWLPWVGIVGALVAVARLARR